MSKYEESGFDDKNEAQAKEIVELMQQVGALVFGRKKTKNTTLDRNDQGKFHFLIQLHCLDARMWLTTRGDFGGTRAGNGNR